MPKRAHKIILFRLDLDLTAVDSATCEVFTGEGVEIGEGSRIPADANTDVGFRNSVEAGPCD